MVKIFVFIACFIFLFCDSSTSTEITCDYGDGNYISVGLIYQCKLSEYPQITTLESAQISSVDGAHEESNTNDDVMGFRAYIKTIQYFPKDLVTFFKNLKAIWIESCGLLEIHQSDLKPFTNLEYFDLTYNKIEVIEEGLFDFNPNLKFVSFWEENIIHIDPNVFDNLNQLTGIYLGKVHCASTDVRDSRKESENIIALIKSQCVDSGYLALEEKIKNLEKESKSLNFYHLTVKMENLRQHFEDSKFSKFRPLNYRFERLNNISQNSENPELASKTCSNIVNPETINDLLTENLKNVSFLIDSLKHSQCGMADDFAELKTSQSGQIITLKEIHSTVTEKLDQIQISQDHLKLSQEGTANSLNELKTEIKSLQTSNSQLISSQNDTLKELKLTQEAHKSSQNILKSSQDNIHSSISDIEVTVSDLKKTQNEFKETLIKIKNSQNEVKIALNDISMNKNDNIEDKLVNFGEKLETLEGHFMDFEVKNTEKFDKIEKEIANSRHKISINFDEKIKGIENRLMKKFEDILGEKLGKIFDEKLGNVLDARLGTE